MICWVLTAFHSGMAQLCRLCSTLLGRFSQYVRVQRLAISPEASGLLAAAPHRPPSACQAGASLRSTTGLSAADVLHLILLLAADGLAQMPGLQLQRPMCQDAAFSSEWVYGSIIPLGDAEEWYSLIHVSLRHSTCTSTVAKNLASRAQTAIPY